MANINSNMNISKTLSDNECVLTNFRECLLELNNINTHVLKNIEPYLMYINERNLNYYQKLEACNDGIETILATIYRLNDLLGGEF